MGKLNPSLASTWHELEVLSGTARAAVSLSPSQAQLDQHHLAPGAQKSSRVLPGYPPPSKTHQAGRSAVLDEVQTEPNSSELSCGALSS